MERDRSQLPTDEARRRFGRTMSAWCSRNGWIHSTMHEWGEQAGFSAVKDSSFNRLQNAKTEQPTPLTFLQLASANRRVAEQNFSGVHDRQLKDRLMGSEPITTPEGKPWGAMEFFGHFVGELDGPDWAAAPESLSEEEAAALSKHYQQRFESVAQAKALSPALAWKQLERHCSQLSPSQRDKLRDVLCGWDQWSPQDWDAMRAHEADPVAKALAAWDSQVDD